MIKTELFNQGMIKPAVREYRNFIAKNPEITVISVNVLKDDSILLTYSE